MSCRLAVSEARLALADFYNVTIRIANVAARLAVLFLWLCDKLGYAISIFVFVGTMVFVNAVADGKPNASEYVFIAFCTAVPWVIGRALRYILAGE